MKGLWNDVPTLFVLSQTSLLGFLPLRQPENLIEVVNSLSKVGRSVFFRHWANEMIGDDNKIVSIKNVSTAGTFEGRHHLPGSVDKEE